MDWSRHKNVGEGGKGENTVVLLTSVSHLDNPVGEEAPVLKMVQ
jgi:hypothetical protein